MSNILKNYLKLGNFLFGNSDLISYTFVLIKARIFRIVHGNCWRTEIRVLNSSAERWYQMMGYNTKYSEKFEGYIIEE